MKKPLQIWLDQPHSLEGRYSSSVSFATNALKCATTISVWAPGLSSYSTKICMLGQSFCRCECEWQWLSLHH